MPVLEMATKMELVSVDFFIKNFKKVVKQENDSGYTKEECDDKGGYDVGSCAEGYGVCCERK